MVEIPVTVNFVYLVFGQEIPSVVQGNYQFRPSALFQVEGRASCIE